MTMIEIHPGIHVNPDAVQLVRQRDHTVLIVMHGETVELPCGNQDSASCAADVIRTLTGRLRDVEMSVKSEPRPVVARAVATGGAASK